MPKLTGTAISIAISAVTKGAVDRHEGAELLADGIPVGRRQEVDPERGEGEAAAPEHRDRRAGQREQHEQAGAGHEVTEKAIGAAVGLGTMRDEISRRGQCARGQSVVCAHASVTCWAGLGNKHGAKRLRAPPRGTYDNQALISAAQ
jgi:hypothetical protein